MTTHAIRMAHSRSLPRLTVGGAGVAAVMSVAHAGNDALTSMLSALLPTLQTRLALSETALALLVAALAFSSSVTQPLFGALSDRFGARRVAALGTAFGVSVLSLITVAPDLAVVFVLLVVGGLGSAAFHPAGTSVVASMTSGRRELAVGLFSAGGSVGLALGPLLVVGLAATLGLAATPLLIVVALGLGGVIFALVPATPTPSRDARVPVFDRSLLIGPVGLLTVSGILSSLAFVTFSSAYPLFLVEVRGLAPSDALLGVTLSVFSFASAAGGIAAAALGGRFDRGGIVAGTLAASLVPLLGLLVVTPGTPLYFATVATSGALVNGSLPLMLIAAHERAPRHRAAASGLLMGFSVGAAGLLYVGVGRLQEALGLAPATVLAFSAVLPAAAFAFAGIRHGAVTTRARPDVATAATPRSCCLGR